MSPDEPAPTEPAPTEPAPTEPSGTGPDEAPAELDDVPPVAGGTDDSPPAQGEGESDSW